MSRVTKAYKIEPRRSNLFNKEKRGVPSSDRSSESQSGTHTERESCRDASLENKLSDSSSQNFSTALGNVREDSPGSIAHKLWNAGLGDPSVS